MLNGSCHCGQVRIDVPDRPAALTLCNCSICRRNGALWAFYQREDVQLAGHPEHTTRYVWGPATIATFHCRTCGCATHWEPLGPDAGPRLGVNMRNFGPDAVGDARLRRFDGAVTWTYLD